MNARLRVLLATGGAVALTLALSTPPTFATAIDSTFTATPGGIIKANVVGKITLTDTKTGAVITCPSSSTTITLPDDGVPHAGSGFGSLSQISLTGCTTVGVIEITLTGADFPWSFNIASFNTVKDVVHGSITGMNFTLTSGSCNAVLDGTRAGAHDGFVKYSYSNKTGHITVANTNGKLILYNVAPACGARFGNGDPITVEGTYTVIPPQDIT
jgi:hypothetical protein